MEKQEINHIRECCLKMQKQCPNLEELAVLLNEYDVKDVEEDLLKTYFLLSEYSLNQPDANNLELIDAYYILKRLYEVFKRMQMPSVTNLYLTCDKPIIERY